MYLSLNKCTKFCLIFLMIALLTLGGVTHAKNPDLSYWMANISESAQADELAEYDYPPEIKVVGNTIHMLWFTRNADWSGHKLYYRRSTDNGVTWDDKQLIFESDDLIYDNTYRRMAVSGNYVHIAISHYEGSWYGVLSYFRSNNGGASFETRKDLFTAAGAYHVYDIYVSAELANVTVGFRNQCNWCVDNQYFLKISSDNGATFNQKTAYATTSGSSWKVGDMQRRGNYIYVLYTDAYYYYGLQYSRLYVAASNDAGVTFQTTKLSFPSKNGADKQGATLQEGHYIPKIAISETRASIIWSGYDAEDNFSVFFCQASGDGTTWHDVENLTKDFLPVGKTLQGGQETLASKGDYIYALYVTTAADIYLTRSADGGATFLDTKKLTTNTPRTNQAWWPSILTDPSDSTGASVFVFWTYPSYAYSSNGGANFTSPEITIPYFSLGGAYPFAAEKPQFAIGEDGTLHYVVSAHYYDTNLCGGYCDYDILYRGYELPPAPSSNDQSLKVTSNTDNRRDNMQVRATPGMDFGNRLTAEVWVKPSPGGYTTGYTTAVKPIFFKQATGSLDFAYSLGTRACYSDRQAYGVIKTDTGTYEVYPSNCAVGRVLDEQWAHLALTYDASGGANNLKLYMNGQLVASRTATGRMLTEEGSFFAGYYGIWELDELRLWNRALSQSEIFSNLPKKLTGNETGLEAYYNFDDTTMDITGNGNDGLLMYQEEFISNNPTLLIVTKTGTGAGTVTSNPAGINCGMDCTEPYPPSTVVTLTAKADTGSLFKGWSGDADCGDGKVTMTTNRSCIATFTPIPVVTVAATDATATEAGLTTGTFTFTRTGSTAAALTVNYTVSGTATAGSDYQSLGTSVSFPAGQTKVTKTVKPLQDTLQELNETVIVTLKQNASYAVGNPGSATVTITSDD